MSEVVTEAPRGFKYREYRKFGATLFNVRRVIKNLKASGELETDRSLVALQVFEVLATERVTVFAEAGADRDWDAFLDFLMKLIEILMQFLPFLL